LIRKADHKVGILEVVVWDDGDWNHVIGMNKSHGSIWGDEQEAHVA
jgi:hypothetical protein